MKRLLSNRMAEAGLAVLILALVGYLASRQSLFLSSGTVAQIFKYYSPMAMLALGMTFVILTGGIDLSVGFVMMLVMFAIAAPMRDNPALPPGAALGIGLAASLLNGAVIGATVAYLRIPAFISSLAAMVAAYGITMILSRNQSIGGLPDAVTSLGGTTFGAESLPLMMIVVAASYLAGALVLSKTAFGRHLYAVGSNREAARLSGVNVQQTEFLAYIILSVCVFVGAWMQLGINRNADPKVALSDSLELNAIAIVVIGGTSLAGGRGTVLGTALGWLLLALIFYGLPLIGINEPSYKKLIQGGIIFLGAVLDALQRRYSRS